MLIVYSNEHRRHAPQWILADGNVRPAPETPARAEAIVAHLQARGSHTVVPPTVDPTEAIALTHDPKMIEYLRTIAAAWREEFGDADVIPDTFVPRGQGPERRPPTGLVGQAGYWCFDLAAPVTMGTYTAAVTSAACAVTAADAVLRGAPAAYALCRPPGHHAGGNYFGGFCYLNNVAIAANYALLHASAPRRLAILDIDYHHGNGTQDIFYEDPRVLTVSVHADPNAVYPHFGGHADERGRGAGAGSNVNLPLPRGCGVAEWFAAYEQALRLVREFAPAMVLVSLGVDTYEQDLVGDFKLAPRDFRQVGELLRTLALPTVVVQEGGYAVAALGELVGNVLAGVEGT